MKTKAKHTPGPWTLYDDGPDGSDIIMAMVGDENYDICNMSEDLPPLERKANSRLIAAAPQLLALVKQYRQESITQGADTADVKEIDDVLRLAGEEV